MAARARYLGQVTDRLNLWRAQKLKEALPTRSCSSNWVLNISRCHVSYCTADGMSLDEDRHGPVKSQRCGRVDAFSPSLKHVQAQSRDLLEYSALPTDSLYAHNFAHLTYLGHICPREPRKNPRCRCCPEHSQPRSDDGRRTHRRGLGWGMIGNTLGIRETTE